VLLAWYLAGWLARYLVIEVAATVGAVESLLGFLIMPVAILARLASFIGMFLVLRDAMPNYSSLKAQGADDLDPSLTPDRRGRRAGVYDLFLVSILPFFAFYAANELMQADTNQYALVTLTKVDFFDESRPTDGVLELHLGWATITAILVAFAGRYFLKKYSKKLPRWTVLVTVYLEAVWVYLTVYMVNVYREEVGTWLTTRKGVTWILDTRERLGDFFAPIGWVWDGIAWVVAEAGGVLLLPLAWLALAGIVYGRSLAQQKLGFQPLDRVVTTARTRLTALPKGVTRRVDDLGTDLVGRVQPLANAIVLIWRAGVVPMGVFVLAYTVVQAATSWGFMGVIQLVGAHDLDTWWMNLDQIYSFGLDAIIEPLRICLIAAGYDYCLRKLEERRDAAAGAAPTAPAAEPTTATA
jgi:hypothetical protein